MTAPEKKITIALAGNANVGKSVIFNRLTGLHQHIGNWPGKTVEKAEGTLFFKGYLIDIIDLPGIYSLSTYSLEELVTRDYIVDEKPDLIINVVDATVLERNLFFTLQLLELETPMIIALNQVDIAKKKGIVIDHRKLSKMLGILVVPTVAVKGTGIYQLIEAAVETVEGGRRKPKTLKYGREIEGRIEKVAALIRDTGSKYPARWTAIKLLEEDAEVAKEIAEISSHIVSFVQNQSKEIEKIHGHSCPTVMTCERYDLAGRITREIQHITTIVEQPLSQRLHNFTTHRLFGYLIMIAVVLTVFYSIFSFGDYTSNLLSETFSRLEPLFARFLGEGFVKEILRGGVLEGVMAGATIALPYIVPFYFLLYILEDSGYLSRVAFLMDAAMHRLGLHGKAFIPIMLAYGCSVPACLGCRIMETERERLLAAFVVTFIPCAATSVVILGLVGRFLSLEWALALYVVDLAIIFILGRIAFKSLPGEPTELIMEMNEYRLPNLKTVANQTWFRLKEFIKIAFPLIIVGSIIIKILEITGLLQLISTAMIPVTVNWLGLRPEIGIALIFGVLRKEFTLIMLATLLGTTNFANVLTPLQMFVFALVTMLYIPCVATIAAFIKEFGWKKAVFVTVFKIAFAVLLGGLFLRTLSLLNMLR